MNYIMLFWLNESHVHINFHAISIDNLIMLIDHYIYIYIVYEYVLNYAIYGSNIDLDTCIYMHADQSAVDSANILL